MPLEASAANEPVSLRLSTGFDSAITDADAGFSRLTGWPRGEALGQTVAILFGPWSDRAAVDRITRAVERGEELEPLPVKLYSYSGNVFDAMVAVAPDGAGGVICRLDAGAGIADVVHRPSDGESRDVVVPAPDRLLPVLIEILNDGVAVVDEDERIVAANGVFARMAGHSAEDLAGVAVARVMELRFPPGENETMGAAVFTAPEATVRGAAVTTGRGIDHHGRPFRVYTFRASAAAAQPRPSSPLEARTEVFEQTLARKVERGGMPVAVGMLEIVADDEMARNLGSIWRDTLERA
ncbi:MAG: PAS domain S-box protein, partial [Zavarzinia sp.]|nr:PAS domain S-box protein [Zavarzinia sp.]